jgi:hypothetical protein
LPTSKSKAVNNFTVKGLEEAHQKPILLQEIDCSWAPERHL